ncbi:cobalt-precorrin 5A hydrolase [Dendrosporobacter sp. 1207_IL3150]|uniref:cobalt-precorrin 5A hydrolase n=1 Tax=Dendrosporobacter sp. 1207_IL3150 TaxID=3084054 RepID=UPI002FDADAD1
MKIAIISVTNNGAYLSEKIAQNFNNVDIFVKKGRNPLKYGQEYESLQHLVAKIFQSYDGLIFVMAAGIVVRVIAPHILDKRTDPAVIVADEAGINVISLLAGHIGGANDLTRLIASNISASPVITTATDVAGKPAADILAVKLGLAFDPFDNLKKANAALANNEHVDFFLDYTLSKSAWYSEQAAILGVKICDLATLHESDHAFSVIITDRAIKVKSQHLFLRPPTLAIGIGCRRGTSKQEISDAIDTACQIAGKSKKSICIIGSTTLKSDEQGLLDTSEELNVPIKFYTNDEIKSTIEKHNLDISSFVNDKIGVGNVCEATAILASQNSKILLPKSKFGRVTVAIVQAK